MKSLAVAFGIVLFGFGLVFAVLSACGLGDKVAGPIAGTFLGAIRWVHEEVEKRISQGSRSLPVGVVSVEGFSIGKPVMFVYATLVTIAILEFFAALSALGILSFGAAIFSGQNPVTSSGSDLFQQFTALVGIMSLPSVFFAIYLLGRWVGARCGRNGLWLMPVALVAARAIDYAAMALYSPEAWRQTRQIFIGREVIGVIIVFVLLALAGDSGVLRGNRIRIGTYLNYLLKQVPKETQDTILNIAFEEASKSTSKASVATA